MTSSKRIRAAPFSTQSEFRVFYSSQHCKPPMLFVPGLSTTGSESMVYLLILSAAARTDDPSRLSDTDQS